MRLFKYTALSFAVAAIALVTPSPAVAAPAVAWNCVVPMLPDYAAKVKEPNVREGVTYLYVGAKNLHENYAADALLRENLDGKHGWYDAGIRLGPLNENNGLVQLEETRWQRFGYALHVAVAWGRPHTTTIFYKDLPIMLSDSAPHRLGMSVRRGRLSLIVDGRAICTTRASYFVSGPERKYFQVRDETGAIGRNGNAVVSDLRLKRDNDAALHAFRSDCILHRFGIFWASTGRHGEFASRGAFYPTEALYFTGRQADQPCKT